MRVMYVASNPEAADTLQVEREASDLQDRLDRGIGADPIEFRAYPHIAVGDLADAIKRFQPDVLHIAAHGEDNAIILSHPSRGEVSLDGTQLAALLGAVAVKPKLLVINACSSDGMARILSDAKAADFVIGTDASITNDAARAMAAALYQRLADGASVFDAFTIAAINLALIGGGGVAANLHPRAAEAGAQTIRLVDPLRIVACLPVVEEWLDEGLKEPRRGFRPELPEVQFGVAGVPAAARQTVFFTDDETVTAKQGGSLEEARSWIIETQPVRREIWMEDYRPYYGNMNWYAAITTTDGRVVSTAGTTIDALRRYYLDELWRGVLPDGMKEIVLQSLACLERNGGSRRGRTATSRAAAPANS